MIFFILWALRDRGVTGKIGKNRPKIGKWAETPIFEPFPYFLGDFFPISPVRPKSIFRRFVFPFRAGGTKREHLLSDFYNTLPSKNPSKNLVFTENPYRHLLRTLLRSTYY